MSSCHSCCTGIAFLSENPIEGEFPATDVRALRLREKYSLTQSPGFFFGSSTLALLVQTTKNDDSRRALKP